MLDPDHSIDTVLTGLREVKPSPGFERRLLQTLAAREAETLPPVRRRWSWPALSARVPLRRHAVVGGAFAVLLVLALGLAFRHQHHSATSHPMLSGSLPSVRTGTSPSQADRKLPRNPNAAPELALNAELRSVMRHPARPRSPQSVRLVPHPAAASSFPAPPMPLTDQEKLLVRVAHARNPQQSPVLNPALRASLAAREDESFQIFFAPATTIKPYEPSN